MQKMQCTPFLTHAHAYIYNSCYSTGVSRQEYFINFYSNGLRLPFHMFPRVLTGGTADRSRPFVFIRINNVRACV